MSRTIENEVHDFESLHLQDPWFPDVDIYKKKIIGPPIVDDTYM